MFRTRRTSLPHPDCALDPIFFASRTCRNGAPDLAGLLQPAPKISFFGLQRALLICALKRQRVH